MAFWATGPGVGELRAQPLAARREGEVAVRTLWTGISRGTESLVLRGAVPESERQRMRAPFQDGEFPFPVKYGYLNVGVVADGPRELAGRVVFTLFPHQSAFAVPEAAVTPVPEGVPPRRAVLAGAVETAVNVLWDADAAVGDRVLVIGAGMIGCSVARLAHGIPASRVTLVDVDASKAAVAERLGVAFAAPDAVGDGFDVVIEASGTPAGLALALRAAPDDGEVVVASWYGDRPVPLELGGDFHSRRLTIRASQVGAVSPRRRAHRSTGERLALALELLHDDAFDALLSGSSPWTELPEVMVRIAAGTEPAMCHTIDWARA
ncbi:dehydrogenase [Gryllotalpicola protaetiae]|uniref:Dehydrogenase n=2 Tax=Gryllotalpicola protaetiae TaxID=2419771 RepID=A0A387BEC1_9MICO|nr:dehydrogenase [Gryllotalpicola protaetiae]